MKTMIMLLITLMSLNSFAADFTITVQSSGGGKKLHIYKKSTNEDIGELVLSNGWSGAKLASGEVIILSKQTIYFDSSNCDTNNVYINGSSGALDSIILGTDGNYYKAVAATAGGPKYPWFQGSSTCSTSTQSNNGFLKLQPVSPPVGMPDLSGMTFTSDSTYFYQKMQ